MQQDPADEAQNEDALNRMGDEPEEESGAGYGNHAVADVAAEPSAPDKDAR
jgi:hypothetical protein